MFGGQTHISNPSAPLPERSVAGSAVPFGRHTVAALPAINSNPLAASQAASEAGGEFVPSSLSSPAPDLWSPFIATSDLWWRP